MPSLRPFLGLAGLLLAVSMWAAPANAQASRTWVSGVGDDANPCSRTAPCKTFAGAISKTIAGGEINCLDPGGFGALTITKSITVSCQDGTGSVLAQGTNGIIVNVTSSDSVYLRGLQIQGVGSGLTGIDFVQAGVLHVDNCLIHGFRAGNAAGIFFAPTGPSSLHVADTVVADNGIGAAGGGIVVRPSGSGSALVSITRARAENNTNGMRADTSGTSGAINLSVNNSVVAGKSANGIFAFTTAGHGVVAAFANQLTASSNLSAGVRADGPTVFFRLGNSAVFANAAGVVAASGATLSSFKNKQIIDNGND